jgi:hypothetical protein
MVRLARIGDRIPGWSVLILAMLLGVATWWRISTAQESLWLDELHTAWCATGDLSQVAPRAAAGNQGPLFFWLEWILTRFSLAAFQAPPTEVLLRGTSLLAGGLLLVAVFLVAHHWLRSAWLGLLAATLIALDPMQHFYATEARPYALVMLLAVLHVALFAELCREPTWRLRLAFILGAAVMFHLHYTAALLLPAELLFWFVARVRRLLPVGYTQRQLTIDLALILVLWLPAAGAIGGIFSRRRNWEAFIPRRPVWEFFELLPWSAAGLLALAAILVERYLIEVPQGKKLESADRLRWRQFAVLCLCWLLVPMALAWVLSWTNVARLFFPRYLVVSLPAAAMLAAACVQLAPWKWSQVVLGGLLAATALWTNLATPTIVREDWRGTVAWLNEQLPQRKFPVFLVGDLAEDRGLRLPHDQRFEDYCLFPVTSLYPVQAPRSDLAPLPSHGAGLLTTAQRDLVRDRGGAWLIVRAPKENLESANAIGQVLAEELAGSGEWWVGENRRGQGVHVVLVVPRARSANDQAPRTNDQTNPKHE